VTFWLKINTTTQHFFFREVNSIIFDKFFAADYDFVFKLFPARQDRSKWPLLQYIRAQFLKANFFERIYLSLIYWSYSWVQKLKGRGLSVASSFGWSLQFSKTKKWRKISLKYAMKFSV
jgi:hypothetical protein